MSASQSHYLIMVVDDEEEIRLSLCDFLELEGYETMVASNGAKALLALETHTPQMIISDLMMPEVDGLTLLDEISRRHIQIPVIIMTAYASVDRAIQAMKNGAADFVTKPLDLDYLLQVVERVKERIRMAEQIKIQQQQLIQSEKMASLGQLIAGVAHEINNPVNFIKSNIEPFKESVHILKSLIEVLLENQERLDPEIQSKIRALREEDQIDYLLVDIEKLLVAFNDGSNRIVKIINDLRIFAQIDEDKQTMIHMGEAIDSSLAYLQPFFGERIVIHKNYGNCLYVSCSPGQMNQVFMNILKNAAEFIEGNGNVWIKTFKEGEKIHVEIKDDGVGISQKNLSKVFDPFFTTKPVGSGTGLGLSLSYGIIEQHGGTITVESEEGKGTTFIITLPIQKRDE